MNAVRARRFLLPLSLASERRILPEEHLEEAVEEGLLIEEAFGGQTTDLHSFSTAEERSSFTTESTEAGKFEVHSGN